MRKLFSPAPLFPSYLQASASGVRKLLSRIGFRLMAFNVLLLFLPFAGILYLGLYEDRLEAAQRRSMAAQARLLSAALSNRGPVNSPESQRILSKLASTTRNEPRARLRVIDTHGHIIADSLHADLAETASRGRTERIRQNWLYRIGAALVRPINRLLTRTEPPLQPAEDYEKSNQLMGPEVQAALRGEYGTDKRSMQSIRSVLLYGAVPITDGPRVIGVAHASQSTFAILQDLYPLRLGLVRIFVVSLVVAVILSLLVSMTIVRPLRRLRQDAGVMVDGRGRLRGMFQGSGKLDEIGDLSRALERLTRRLDGHVRFIESFASDVSHEFKNPLASIRTASEMLGEVEEPAERRRFRKMVDQEIARMENLLSGVREITFIDSQMATEAMTTVAVDQLLAQIVEGFKLRSLPKFEVKSDGGAMVKANAERLTQVFENVLDNAVSFSAPGQTISVETESKDGTVITRIADQGPGIPAAHMEKIFDRFFTYREGTDKRRTGHTGLGLAIVRAIVEGYGGTITAANRPDGGAVFEIHLPASRS